MRVCPQQATLIVGLFLIVINTSVLSHEPIERSNRNQEFTRALAFLQSFKNDSANIILTKLMVDLIASDELETPFGLNVQLRQAQALERDHQDELAIEKLLSVADKSTALELWDVAANATLDLARLFEKLAFTDQCYDHLQKANSLITSHELDSIYPRFAIRFSSYHRIYADKDSAMYYAKEVILTAPLYGLYEEEAVGHLLLGMLLSDSAYKQAVYHFEKAGARWKLVEDWSGYGATLLNLCKLHLRNQKPKLAMALSDSSLVYAAKAKEMGNDETWMAYTAYKRKSEIFKALNRPDSALFYMRKGYEMELDDIYDANDSEVAEINERYEDEKKEQMIKEQARELSFEKEKRYWLWAFSLILVTFASGLTYSYIQLRKANIKTSEQKNLINKTNKELSNSLKQQVLLQGELHHRVKNNLQVILGIMELQRDEIQDPLALKSMEAMSSRIYSIAAIHEILYQKEGVDLVNLSDYTVKLCNHFSNFLKSDQKPSFDINIIDKYFNQETLIPFGIILTELINNSLKYAYEAGSKLKIGISLRDSKDGYCLDYRDNGPGFPKGILEEREGALGAYLLNSMVRQLDGKLETSNRNGAYSSVFFKEKVNTRV